MVVICCTHKLCQGRAHTSTQGTIAMVHVSDGLDQWCLQITDIWNATSNSVIAGSTPTDPHVLL
jgi:hypothetical protein